MIADRYRNYFGEYLLASPVSEGMRIAGRWYIVVKPSSFPAPVGEYLPRN